MTSVSACIVVKLLRELQPAATNVAVLVNPSAPPITEQFMRTLQAAAPALGMELHVMQLSTDRDLDGAHKAAARQSLSGIPCTTALELTSNNGATSGAAFVALAPAMTAVLAIPDLQQAKALLDKLD